MLPPRMPFLNSNSNNSQLSTSPSGGIYSPSKSDNLLLSDGSTQYSTSPSRPAVNHTSDNDLIPTAIVIKNIPFAVKKEQLMDTMMSLGLTLPYAFNYHFDQGVFRGLAFANFATAEDTASVINVLNGHEISGRKLRVEYKKMLPVADRERIEREKRSKRGQLEEQHRSSYAQLPKIGSMNSLSATIDSSPSSVSSSNGLELDLNDPETLMLYSEILLFRDDHARDELVFGSGLSAMQKRTVSMLANGMGLMHSIRGEPDAQEIIISRRKPSFQPAPLKQQQHQQQQQHHYRQQINDQLEWMGDAKHQSTNYLRGTRSYADIRSSSRYAPTLHSVLSNGNMQMMYGGYRHAP